MNVDREDPYKHSLWTAYQLMPAHQLQKKTSIKQVKKL